LAHVLSGADLGEHVGALLKSFWASGVEAVIIKSAGKQSDDLAKACSERGIRILRAYRVPMSDSYRARMYDVIVRPGEGKVLVSTDELGLHEIDF